MNNTKREPVQATNEGIHITADQSQLEADQSKLEAKLAELSLESFASLQLIAAGSGPSTLKASLLPDTAEHLTPAYDTTRVCATLGLDTEQDHDLEREIMITMLRSPWAFVFPSYEELASTLNIRRNIVKAARKTRLAFDTVHAERPEGWTYAEGRGFTVLPGQSLISLLQKATQPDQDKLYSFSCYRATEYVTLLSIALELEAHNLPLLKRLQRQWETRAVMSGQFHDVFLYEYGSEARPLPSRYYVPGDRLWFRNPDERSSDIEGYEGSWLFYLGGGLFSNFWKPDMPYTFTSKCVELYHWRNAVRHDSDGKAYIDEAVLDSDVLATIQDAAAVREILRVMEKPRDPRGVSANGGCIDISREYPRRVRAATADIPLPDA